MYKKIIEDLKPAIRRISAKARVELPLFKRSINLLIERGERDPNHIETLLDYLLDTIQVGIGEEEFLMLLDYYAKIAPGNAASYRRFYETDFGNISIQEQPLNIKEAEAKKINFIYNSNLIESIDIPLEQYTADSQNPLVKGHFEAFDFMLEHYQENIGQKNIKKLHQLLTAGVLDKYECGQYRQEDVYIVAKLMDGRDKVIARGVTPEDISFKMSELVTKSRSAKTENSIWNIHHEFEIIHPFVDGNGRLGRLLLNWLRLKNGFDLLTVDIKERKEYYNKINEYRRRLVFKEKYF